MDLDKLRSIQNAARRGGDLQPLPDDFYDRVGKTISEIKSDRRNAAAAATDPFDSKCVRQITNEIETMESVAKSIWDARVQKLIRRAILEGAGQSTEIDHLSSHEQELFQALVTDIEACRDTVFEWDEASADRSTTESNPDTNSSEEISSTHPVESEQGEASAMKSKRGQP